jgi:ABC-2 type transport system ATP-binding protein
MHAQLNAEIILSVHQVRKHYEGTRAVDGVSFEIYPGEIFGLLGPNGAGKTTLIRMILGIIQPDSGEIAFSFSADKSFRPEKVGYLPEERGLYDDRKVSDTLVFFARLKKIPAAQARERGLLWLTRLGLETYFDRKIRELSKGMQQKVQFVASILHQPALVILDEPFAGLDPINQELFRDLILELKSSGTTVLLSAHQMHLVEDLCDRIFLIHKGRPVLYGNLREIKRAWGEDWVKLDFRGDGAFLMQSPLVKSAELKDSRAELILKKGVQPEAFLDSISGKLEIEQISIQKPPLHHIFVETVTQTRTAPGGEKQ